MTDDGKPVDEPVEGRVARRLHLSPPIGANLRGRKPPELPRWYLALVCLVWVTAFALLLFWLGGRYGHFYEAVYRSLTIFTPDSGWIFEEPLPDWVFDRTWPVDIFRIITIIGLVLTAVGILQLFNGAAANGIVRTRTVLRLWFGAGTKRAGIGIIGLTDASVFFARQARLAGYTPVICVTRPDHELAQFCRAEMISLTRMGSGTTPPYLLRQMNHLISFLPTIGEQIDLAEQIHRWPNHDDVIANLIVADRGIAQRLEAHLKFAGEVSGAQNDAWHPRLLHLPTLAASQALARHPLDLLADAFGQRQIHLAIYGFGEWGRAIAKCAVQLYVTRPSLGGQVLRITIIDRHPEAARAALLAEAPEIETIAQIVLLDEVIFGPTGLTAAEFAASVPPDVTAHVIALPCVEHGFTLAASLRRWLLEPPAAQRGTTAAPDGWQLAPILLRTPDWTGLGSLVRCARDGDRAVQQEVPEAIYGFGAIESLLNPAYIASPTREDAAKTLHEAYTDARRGITARNPDEAARKRAAERDWHKLQPAMRDSNFHAVEHIAVKARAIGYRLVPAPQGSGRPSPPSVPFSEDDRHFLAQLEHRRFTAERLASGWRHAVTRCDAAHTHQDLVSWEQLLPDERKLDYTQIDALPRIAAASGHRLLPALYVGVTGHLAAAFPPDEAGRVKGELKAALTELRDTNSDRALVLLTALAAGADSWAAQAADDLGIPFIVPLPLPHELYHEDFPGIEHAEAAGKAEEADHRQAFHALIAKAAYFIELPLRFGSASELTTQATTLGTNNAVARAAQYALAGAYIVERAEHLLAVWDGGPSRGTGGTAEVVSWARGETPIPPQYRTSGGFFPRPAHCRTTIIASSGKVGPAKTTTPRTTA